MYRFSNLGEYSGLTQMQVGWDAAGDEAQTYYVGLANFGKDRWDWYKFPPTGRVTVPSFSNFDDGSGGSVAVVVSLDNGEFVLDYVLAGTNTKPVVMVETDLNPDPLQNVAPVVVSFNATSSRSYGGSLTSFDFDWEGDGTWDVTDNTDGLGIHQFSAGNYETKIRATDNLGQQTTAVVQFAAINPANQPPVASFTRTPSSGDAPLTVDFDASGSTDPDGYIVQYEWDMDNDGQYESASESPLASRVFAQAGSNLVKLRVTDNFYATHVLSLDVTINKGWRNNLIDEIDTRYPVAICTTGTGADARACVAYQEFDGRDLRFKRANNIEASSWSGFVNPVPTDVDTGFSPTMDVVTTTGGPIIAYGHGVAGQPLYIVTATDNTGSTWNTPVLVDGTSNVGGACAMAGINNLPCIAATNRFVPAGSSTLLYYQAGDPTGASWSSPRIALPAIAGISYELPMIGKSATGLFKRPIVACGIEQGGTKSGLALAAATNVDGTAWNSPSIFDGWVQVGSVRPVDGRPAFFGAGIESSPDNAYYVRSNNGDGSSWPAEFTVLAQNAVCVDMQIFNGKPFMFYQDYPARKLMASSATDASASAWEPPYVISGGMSEYNVMVTSTVVDGKPVIAYVYISVGLMMVRSVSFY